MELILSEAIPIDMERSACMGRLKELGEQMAAKCGNLPLVLFVKGGLWSQNQGSIAEWEVFGSMVLPLPLQLPRGLPDRV